LAVSGFPCSALSAAIRWSLDSHRWFPEFCAESAKWFRRGGNCFVAAVPMKQLLMISNDFNGLNGRPMGQRLGHWPT